MGTNLLIASSRVAFLIGFVRWSVHPAAKLRSLASRNAWAVSRKMGVGAERAHLAGCGIAVQNRHLSVHENHVVGTLLELLHRLRAVLHFVDDAAGILQVAADQEAIFFRIVGQKNPQRSSSGSALRSVFVSAFAAGPSGDRESRREMHRAARTRRALGPDSSAHQFNEALGDGQTQAGAAEFARGGSIGLRESCRRSSKVGRPEFRCRYRRPRSAVTSRSPDRFLTSHA